MANTERNNMNGFWDKVDMALERFFALPAQLLTKFGEWFFEYIYREAEEGVFGLFPSPERIKKAAAAARDKGYTNFDCFTPFPVHGLEFDMGFQRSKVPYITFFAGLIGCVSAFLMQYAVHEQFLWTEFLKAYPNLNSYPLNIAGKPTYSWPAMVPIMFELTVLFGGHTTVAGLILLARMYRPSRRVLHPQITNDQFCLWIPSDSANYSKEGVESFLKELGASEITAVSREEKK